MLDEILAQFPKKVALKANKKYTMRPLKETDEKVFYQFFQAIPEQEKLFMKHRVSDPKVIRGWCKKIDLGRILPLLALDGSKVIADASLHQQLGGWKRHVGRVSVLVHPEYRGQGLARVLVQELLDLARHIGLEKIEAEFIGDQTAAIKMFGLLGFRTLLALPEYVKDMQAITHDYVLMGVDMKTDEEYAGVG
jgi:GNAT superfamily N-acetyltransferase